MIQKKNSFNFDKTNWWKLALQISIVTLIVFGLEMFDYFFVGVFWGKLFDTYGDANPTATYTLNLQLPIDKIMPWCTWIYPFYIVWPYMWFVGIPLVMYFAGGKKHFYKYCVNSLIMYVVSMFIYALLPTTCAPKQFINENEAATVLGIDTATLREQGWGTMYDVVIGTEHNHSWDWAMNAGFHTTLIELANDSRNIWGASPSFHNYWAALFIMFAFDKKVRRYWKAPMITIGALISFSTLTLHQHNLADVLMTYSMVYLILLVDHFKNYTDRFIGWYDKTFRLNVNH